MLQMDHVSAGLVDLGDFLSAG